VADARERYDVAIIGSGISGSSLGAILARHGLRVVIFEAGVHPKFAVGESMILETSETMRAMAELFDVPELAFFSSKHYLAQIGASHGLKRHFSFLHHEEGRPQELRRSLQAVIPQSNYKLWSVYSILWLLGAYTEYVKLLSTRGRARSRAEYFAVVQTLRLVGGGFGEFKALADRIDAIIEAVDPCDEAAVERAVTEIRALYDATPWIPWAFRQLLAGRNHLPRNKLRLSLLRQSSAGFMGEGAFRRHFFGDATMAEVARFFASESVKYSASALTLRKRLGFRRRPTALNRVRVSRG